ncbi:MAG TPA: flavin reductase family protein [Bacteroidota bacterium]|nr:flavin reductase family protein [Bacteroidota bacterium]
MTILPADHPPGDVYRLMTAIIVPRPIAFVSSLSRGGIRNLAPFSFFTAVSANPPVVCFAPMIRGRDGTRKDTLNNIEETGEFVVNIVSEEIAGPMNACSAEVPPEVDEFALSGLTPVPSERVAPPRVGESKASMECRLLQIVHVSPRPLGGSLVLGEVLVLHVNDPLFHNFSVDPAALNAIGRMGGATYARTTDRFEMPRPGPVGPRG